MKITKIISGVLVVVFILLSSFFYGNNQDWKQTVKYCNEVKLGTSYTEIQTLITLTPSDLDLKSKEISRLLSEERATNTANKKKTPATIKCWSTTSQAPTLEVAF